MKHLEYHAHAYDNRNRLTQVTVGGTVVASYTYDALNRRIGIDDNGTQTWVVFDGTSPDANPYADFNGSGILLQRYVSTQAVDEILARTSSGGTTAWYLTDRLGSVRDVVSTSGTVLDHVIYDSYGNIVTETNAANGDRFKFTGMEWDAAISHYYDHARFYSSANARFNSMDPLGFNGGDMNNYRYARNSPINASDPTGLQAGGAGRVGFPGPWNPPWNVEPRPGWQNLPSKRPYPHNPNWHPDPFLPHDDPQWVWWRQHMKDYRRWYRAWRQQQAQEDADMWADMEREAAKFQAEVDEMRQKQQEEQAEMLKTLYETEKRMFEEAQEWLKQALSGQHTPYIPPPEWSNPGVGAGGGGRRGPHWCRWWPAERLRGPGWCKWPARRRKNPKLSA